MSRGKKIEELFDKMLDLLDERLKKGELNGAELKLVKDLAKEAGLRITQGTFGAQPPIQLPKPDSYDDDALDEELAN